MARIPKILKEALKNVLGKPFTEMYPFEKKPVPEGFRGRHEVNIERCTGCSICVKICPAQCIQLIEVKRADTGEAKLVPSVDLAACLFCGLCEEFCEHSAIRMGSYYELASVNKADLILRPS
ncbi:MAG: NADH-quinone oxidoreductase subunit I [Nitrososphaerota archaeon]|nr:NADH-quinone oxidoreductase subunit I [Nitrososphaerales archaeon]MDW8044507.1 NADH-quinone oxidoreductase subunit I [Nitrososphaerota archaeon]